LHLVRLDVLLFGPAREEVSVPLERAADVVPRRLARKHEVVQPTEQPQRKVPGEIGSDVADPRILREPTTYLRIQG